MTLPGQYDRIPCDETRREAVSLVARMMRYRMDTIADLQDDIQLAVLSLHDRSDLKRLRRATLRIAEMENRIQLLVRDTQYDAAALTAILRQRADGPEDGHDGRQADPVTYIT